MKVYTFFTVFLLLFATFLITFSQAEESQINYTDGTGVSACDKYSNTDDVYTLRFDPPVPITITRFRFTAEGEGQLEAHIWPDRDGLPDMTWDLTEPVTIDIKDGQLTYWVEFDQGKGPTIDPALPFHVGLIKKADDGGYLCYDATEDWAMRSKYRINGEWRNLEEDWWLILYGEYLQSPEPTIFSDASEQAGILSPGNRVAVADYDNDGFQDILFSGLRLYKNNGDGTFEDVTESAGLNEIPGNGALWADFDNDGDLDFFAMNGSRTDYDRFVENNGDGTFTDITETAIVENDKDFYPTEGAGWGDYDGDGYLDLYLANYELPQSEAGDLSYGTPDKLYHNNGDGTFTDVAEALGIDPGESFDDRLCGRGVNWGDFNDDGHQDIFVSNYRLDPNFLYVNNGDGTFTETAAEKGVQGYMISMAWGHTIGSAWGDFNNDAYLDLFNANLAHPRFAGFSDFSLLYQNTGAPDYNFTDISKEARIIFIETNSEPCLGDWNNDGWLDLLITNVYEDFWPQLYRNNGDGTLTEMNYFSGLDIENGWGAAFADYDNDGFLDVIAMNRADAGNGLEVSRSIWQNNGNENHWIKVKLECTSGNPQCVGARVEVQLTEDSGIQAKEVISGKGTTNSPPFELHFGANQCDTVYRVTAKMPDGTQIDKYEVDADDLLTIADTDASDTKPAKGSNKSSCADVDYTEDTWPDTPDDDDTADDDDESDDDSSDDSDDDDDDSGCCG